MTSLLAQARHVFHACLIADRVLTVTEDGVASHADGSQGTSVAVAAAMAKALGVSEHHRKLGGQRAGKLFEEAVKDFVAATFPVLQMARPGNWSVHCVGSARTEYQVSAYEPYRHLRDLAAAVRRDPALTSALGNSYDISPDVLVVRAPVTDAEFNATQPIVDDTVATRSVLRASRPAGTPAPIVHAVISCKWTLRSDRAQNARSEALNIMRNRKGRTPHIAVVTAEPSASRLASLALGTGDVDMVYHFALDELIDAVAAHGSEDSTAMLSTLVDGQRLRDITDLPLDLAV